MAIRYLKHWRNPSTTVYQHRIIHSQVSSNLLLIAENQLLNCSVIDQNVLFYVKPHRIKILF